MVSVKSIFEAAAYKSYRKVALKLMQYPRADILVISYFFPPFKRVGGRRWAKHVKYMQAEGARVIVLAGEFSGRSSWDDDLMSYKERIVRIPLRSVSQPYFKKKHPVTIFQKVLWHLSFFIWKIRSRLMSGNFRDLSRGMSWDFMHKAESIIQESGIKTVILSVGPFRYCEIVPELKKKFPQVNFMLDFRDKWEDGLNDLTGRQKDKELSLQKRVLASADAIITVNDDLRDHLSRLAPDKKVFTLPHCVDEDFYNLSLQSFPESSDTISRFIYGGELYNKMEQEINCFIRFFSEYKKRHKASAEVYLTYPNYEQQLKKAGVQVNGFLDKETYQEKLAACNFILLFRPAWSPDAFSSKFFEILCFRKPVIYFGKPGAVSEFIETNKLGIHLDPTRPFAMDNLVARLDQLPDKHFDLASYTFAHHTRLLLSQPELNFHEA